VHIDTVSCTIHFLFWSGIPLDGDASFRTVGRVKWFDSVKGYGFIVPDEPVDGIGGDVLLHMSVLRSAGFSTVPENARIVCDAVKGERGAQAIRVLELDDSVQTPDDFELYAMDDENTQPVEGGALLPIRVKWFDRAKGFGFGNMIGDASDIFIHMEVLRRFGLPDLAPGEAILSRVVRGPRGMTATEVRPWDHSFPR